MVRMLLIGTGNDEIFLGSKQTMHGRSRLLFDNDQEHFNAHTMFLGWYRYGNVH